MVGNKCCKKCMAVTKTTNKVIHIDLEGKPIEQASKAPPGQLVLPSESF